MKKVIMMALTAASLFAMGADTVESLTICDVKGEKYLITVIKNEDVDVGRAMFIDSWDNLKNDQLSYFLPIVNNKSFKTVENITKWVTQTFGKASCASVSYEAVQSELDRQTEIYKNQ